MNRPLIRYIRLVLLPFSWLYGLILYIRHYLYDTGAFARTSFPKPVIVIGNLELGGTGKTPMTEYVIRLFKDKQRVAVLSRGYGRQSRGYLNVLTDTPVDQSGDEPLQIKQKFPDLTVAVCEDRVQGVQRLQGDHDLIVLDDAFQHRALQGHFNILLFNYATLHWRFLLPAGNYRDVFTARKRAHTLIVTKCPPDLGEQEKEAIRRLLSVPGRQIPVLFTSIEYGSMEHMSGPKPTHTELENEWDLARHHVLLVTGIARPQPLLDRMKQHAAGVTHLAYADHHRFSEKDLQDIERKYQELPASLKVIVTTEKDAQRLTELPPELPLYYLPIQHNFHEDGAHQLEQRLATLL